MKLIGAPEFIGPRQYLQCKGQIKLAARRALAEADSVLFRGCNTMSMPLYRLCRRTQSPTESRSSAIRTIHSPQVACAIRCDPTFVGYLRDSNEQVCRDALAATYVTERALQERYPPGKNRFATSYSDVVIPPECFSANSRNANSSTNRLHLVTVGTMAVMYKAYDVLIAALAEVVQAGADLDLTIIGDGKHQAELQELATRLGISDRVIFRGRVSAGPPIFAELDRPICSYCRRAKKVCRARWSRRWRAAALHWEHRRRLSGTSAIRRFGATERCEIADKENHGSDPRPSEDGPDVGAKFGAIQVVR